MRPYRLAKTARAADLLGEGARRVGGRRNYPGTPVIYTAQSGSLAKLEVLQYVEVTDVHSFSMLEIDVPDDASVQRVQHLTLPPDWNQFPHPSFTRDIGQAWLIQQADLLLAVPSAVYPEEYNVLINPPHPAFAQVRIAAVKPFVFNDRLFGKRV